MVTPNNIYTIRLESEWWKKIYFWIPRKIGSNSFNFEMFVFALKKIITKQKHLIGDHFICWTHNLQTGGRSVKCKCQLTLRHNLRRKVNWNHIFGILRASHASSARGIMRVKSCTAWPASPFQHHRSFPHE